MKDWNEAKNWIEKANEGKQPEWFEANWSWDCGFKLDFDGGLLRTCSRFYQERENCFSGSVTFLIGDDEVFSREFSCRCLDVLKDDVEKYVDEVRTQITSLCLSNLQNFITAK